MQSRGNQGVAGFRWNASVQKELEGAKKSKTAFLRIAREMNEVGCERTWQQLRVKVTNIVSNYRNIQKVAKCTLNELSFFFSSTLFTVFTANY